VLANIPFDGTSAVIEGNTYTEADLADGMWWNISSVGGGAMEFVLRRKPASGSPSPEGDGYTPGEYLAVQEKGYRAHAQTSVSIPQADLSLVIEPRFAFDTYVRMSHPAPGNGAFRWIANQN